MSKESVLVDDLFYFKLLISSPILIKFSIFFIGAFLYKHAGHPFKSDLFTSEITYLNLIISLIYFLVFLTALKFSGKNGSEVIQLPKSTERNLLLAISSIYVASALTLALLLQLELNLIFLLIILAFVLPQNSYRLLGHLLMLLLSFVAIYDHVSKDSYLPAMWGVLISYTIFYTRTGLMTGARRWLTGIAVIMALAFVLAYGKLYGLLIIRFIEQIAPASWGNYDFSAFSYFFGIAAGAPEHRKELIESGLWSPQFQLSYFFNLGGLVWILLFFAASVFYSRILTMLYITILNQRVYSGLTLLLIGLYVQSCLSEPVSPPGITTSILALTYFILYCFSKFSLRSH